MKHREVWDKSSRLFLFSNVTISPVIQIIQVFDNSIYDVNLSIDNSRFHELN